MTGDFWLSDEQWRCVQPLLPNKPRGVPRVDDRRVVSGIIYVLLAGCYWRDAPKVYGPPKTLYNRCVRWAAKGVWPAVFQAVEAEGGPSAAFLTTCAERLGGRRPRGQRRTPQHKDRTSERTAERGLGAAASSWPSAADRGG